jgi:serine/threonine-protein kinase RIO1
MTHINILMVDDHPIIIEGYQNVLMATKQEDQILNIDTANNCDGYRGKFRFRMGRAAAFKSASTSS